MEVTFLFSVFTFAQDAGTDFHSVVVTVPELSLMDIEPSADKNLAFTFTHNGEAGIPIINPAPDNSLCINYSVIISSTNLSKKINVSPDSLMLDVGIKFETSSYSGSYGGKGIVFGDSALKLTTSSQDIVFSIHSSYTGDGEGFGHRLTYDVAFAEFDSVSYGD